jgi:hypothetical protein
VWNWLKRKGSKPGAPAVSAGQFAADKALEKEDRKLREMNGRTGEIIGAAESLKALGVQNDFAVKIRRAMGGAGG